MTFTQLEKDVFNIMAKESLKGGFLAVEEIADALNMTVNSVKGVVGSLVKKRKLKYVDDDGYEEFMWPVHPEHGIGFWGDWSLSEQEINKALL